MVSVREGLGWKRRHAGLLAVAVVSACAGISPAAAQARAGSWIPNGAHLVFEIDGTPAATDSNVARTQVAELLDLGLAAPSLRVPVIPSSLTAISFTLINQGNGREAFGLTASFPAGTIEGFAIDADGDGRYDPARDVLLPGGVTPRLDPGQALALLALVRSTADTAGTLTLAGRALTASGRRGEVVATGGDDGSVAVVGRTTASATLVFTLLPANAGDPVLEKRQAVADPQGSGAPVRGAIVTYTLVARFPGRALDAAVTDPIPAGTAYVPGSLSLDGAALSDAADGDPGSFDGAGIRVALGDIAGAAMRTIQFKVLIQ